MAPSSFPAGIKSGDLIYAFDSAIGHVATPADARFDHAEVNVDGLLYRVPVIFEPGPTREAGEIARARGTNIQMQIGTVKIDNIVRINGHRLFDEDASGFEPTKRPDYLKSFPAKRGEITHNGATIPAYVLTTMPEPAAREALVEAADKMRSDPDAPAIVVEHEDGSYQIIHPGGQAKRIHDANPVEDLPAGLHRGDAVYGNDKLIGHIALLIEESAPPKHGIIRSTQMVIDEVAYTIPICFDVQAAREVANEALAASGGDIDTTTIDVRIGGNTAKLTPSMFSDAPRTLYHYTSTSHWPLIQKAGYLKVVESNILMDGTGGPDVVWLTDEPNLTPASAGWARGTPVDKTKVRITVRVNDAEPWSSFAMRHHIAQEWYDALASSGGDPNRWWVVARPINQKEWLDVRIGDTPVAKQPLPRVQKRDPETPWLNNSGEQAMCDFCGSFAAWRYACRVFEIGEWVNGGDDRDPGDADWAACTICAVLIESRRKKDLLARNKNKLHDVVVLSGKHGTDNGKYDEAASIERIAGFFKYWRKTRIWIGGCDFCAKHGESVRWFYPITSYSFVPEWVNSEGDDVSYGGGLPWAACNMCSDLVEHDKRTVLVERMVRNFSAKYNFEKLGIPKLTQQMRPWLQAFFDHRNGPRFEIPDRPAPMNEQAPLAAQQALEQQLTLLRWLEGSNGREWIAAMDNRFSGKRQPLRAEQMETWLQPLRSDAPYYWEPRIAEQIRQATNELRDDPLGWPLTREMLPAPQGFFYSDTPLNEGMPKKVRAVGWTIAYELGFDSYPSPTTPGRMRANVVVPLHGGGDMNEAKGIVVTFWSEDTNRAIRPTGLLVWAFGVSSAELFKRSGQSRELSDSLGEQPEILASMLAFIRQRIVVAGHAMPVSSVMRKRIEREHPEHVPAVRVITLRRIQSADYHAPTESTGRHLTVQFRVRGFWRHNHCFNPHGHAEAETSGAGCMDHGSVYVNPHWRGPVDGQVQQARWGDLIDVAR
jgi:hypothetical protein